MEDSYPDKVESSVIPGSLNISSFYYAWDGTNLAAKMPGNSFNYESVPAQYGHIVHVTVCCVQVLRAPRGHPRLPGAAAAEVHRLQGGAVPRHSLVQR